MTKEERIKTLMNNYEHSLYFSSSNPFNNYYKEEFEKIDFNSEHWIEMYNNYFFNDNNFDLKNICQDYLTSLKWCFDYYTTNEPPSWYFAYKHRNAPPLQTFLEYGNFERYTNFMYKKLYILPVGVLIDEPITPYEQMLIVLPIQNMSLLPTPFKCFVLDEGSPLNFMYKRNFKLDVLVGFKNIYSEPILDEVDFEKVKIVLNNVLLNDMEWSRNIIRKLPFRRTFGKIQNKS
jgi:5'-3' exonuclease